MKRILLGLALAGIGMSSMAGTNVGLSVTVNEPGMYGRIDIGNVAPPPAPALIYAQPVLIAPPTVVVRQQPPLYLHVPPGHAKDWAKHCGQYNACGQPVYFVKDDWYENQYVPAHKGKGQDKGHGNGKGKGKHDN